MNYPGHGYVAIGVLAVAVSIGVLLIAPAKKHAAQRDSPFGPYAGFRWRGRVASVEGAWIVPRIQRGSQSGLAGTWIASQGSGPGPPFVQAGDNEARGYSEAGKPPTAYWAFWTDTKLRFHPQLLFRVSPGDELVSDLVLSQAHWIITVVDETSGRHARAVARSEAPAAFDEAQWMQENERDPTGNLAPYPSLTPVRFQRIAVNGWSPSLLRLDYACMSIGGTVWAPSRPSNDGFTISGTAITELGRGSALPCHR